VRKAQEIASLRGAAKRRHDVSFLTVGSLSHLVAIPAVVATIWLAAAAAVAQQPPDLIRQPYLLDTGLVSRSLSFENPTGAQGEGGKAASELGVGRKGAAWHVFKPGETVSLCDIDGPGTIRRLWMTMPNSPINQRSVVIRAYWEGQKHPSIECPVGDFFGNSHGKLMSYQSAVHSTSASGALNIWLPMPFVKHAKVTLTNEGTQELYLFYQMELTLKDKHPDDVGRLHVLFRRENPTTEKKDFELLPLRKNKGRYIGTVIGVRDASGRGWCEGEVKVYMDGDTKFPTICGTGSEDYAGLAWGISQTAFLYPGCSLAQKEFVSFYRWHLPDPYAWQKEARITIQQMTWSPKTKLIEETHNDWSCATFWYEPTPSAPLPPLPDVKARTADLWKN
jgi:hypothetical protein